MDGDFLWLVLIGFIVIMMIKGGKHGRRQRQTQQDQRDRLNEPPPSPPQLIGPTRAEVERLEQRVRVLERIVTDSGYSLASQIEALRDDRRAERPVAAGAEEEKI